MKPARTLRQPTPRTCGWLLLALTALSGCEAHHANMAWHRAQLTGAPVAGDGGVEILRTSMIPGAAALTAPLTTDCFGPGLAVETDTVHGTARQLFDRDGELCGQATVLFDGRTPLGQRQADPAITLHLHDELRMPLPPQERGRGERPTIRLTANPELDPPLAAVQARSDALLSTLAKWQQADLAMVERSVEQQLAAERELARLAQQAEAAGSDELATLMASKLRAQERTLEAERLRHAGTLARSAQNRAETSAVREAWQQEQNRLTQELAAARARASQFEELAARLKAEQQQAQARHTQDVAQLATQLQFAESQAEAGRRQLLMQAAAKLAEAEALATAARVESEQAQLAQAQRLQAEANRLMDRVLLARADELGALEPKAGPTAPLLPLREAPVVLQAKERTLPEILTEVLQQAAAHSGAWRADWQLGASSEAILADRWSLTAEADVGQILTTLQQQVAAAHGVTLTFAPFAQTRVLVVTASPVAPSGLQVPPSAPANP